MIFDAVDTDGSGLIDASELQEALKGMGRDATDNDVAALMKKLNVVGNEIDFDTFCKYVKRVREEAHIGRTVRTLCAESRNHCGILTLSDTP